MYVRASETRVILSVYVDDIKMASKNRMWLPCGKVDETCK